jgi:hypothetical protein
MLPAGPPSMGVRSSTLSYSLDCTAIPSTKLQTHVVSLCMGCGHPAAQQLQVLRAYSITISVYGMRPPCCAAAAPAAQ